MERPTVLLATIDTSDYSAALERAGFDTIDDPAEAQQRLRDGASLDLAVLDCDADPVMVARTHALLHGERSVPTLLLFGEELPTFEGSTANDELAMKPLPADALVYRLQALLIRAGRQLTAEGGGWGDVDQDEHGSIGEGHVVSVFAPKGGVGKTTIAVNAAVALREQTHERVLLLDADVGVGNVTAVLAAPQTMGLVGLADSPPSEWTDAAFEQVISVHPGSGVRVLTWGSEPGDSERVTVDLLLAAVRWGRMHHAYVVIDNHPGYSDRTMAMLTVSRETLLVVTPEVGPLRNAAQFLDLFRQLGLGDTVQVVVNRANHGIRLDDMAQSLGLPIAATVISNGPKAVIAANEGTPVITKFPREKISTDLHGIARLITRQQAPEPATSGKRWWMPFASRVGNA
jgi:MinD-like ATPase involved in chromosome partitioning or flagellar assembly